MNHEIVKENQRLVWELFFRIVFLLSIAKNAENTFDNKKLFYVLNNRKWDVFRKHLFSSFIMFSFVL